MRAFFGSWFVLAFLQILAPRASAQPVDLTIETSLKRIDVAAKQIALTYCEPDKRRVFEGAVAGINAMPERKGAVPLQLGTPDFDGFAKVYRHTTSMNTNTATVEQAAIKGMGQVFDTEILFGAMASEPRNPWVGIGVEMTQDAKGVTSVRPFDDAPAARAGLQANDQLKAVDGTSMMGLPLEEVSRYLRGDPESTVTLTVVRAGNEMTLKVKRAAVRLPGLKWYREQGVGVIQFTRFGEDTGDEVKSALLALRRQRPQPIGYILDLRGNTGGELAAIIKVLDQFIDGGPIMDLHPLGSCGPERIERHESRPGDLTQGARIVILVNSGTASGAEIAAASMRERRQAILVGQKTYGSATIQTVIPLQPSGNDYILLTTGTMRTPSGMSFHQIGLVPDVLVETSLVWDNSAMERALQILTAKSGNEPILDASAG